MMDWLIAIGVGVVIGGVVVAFVAYKIVMSPPRLPWW